MVHYKKSSVPFPYHISPDSKTPPTSVVSKKYIEACHTNLMYDIKALQKILWLVVSHFML